VFLVFVRFEHVLTFDTFSRMIFAHCSFISVSCSIPKFVCGFVRLIFEQEAGLIFKIGKNI